MVVLSSSFEWLYRTTAGQAARAIIFQYLNKIERSICHAIVTEYIFTLFVSTFNWFVLAMDIL